MLWMGKRKAATAKRDNAVSATEGNKIVKESPLYDTSIDENGFCTFSQMARFSVFGK